MSVKLTLGGPASNKPPSPEPEPSEDHYPQKLTLDDGREAWVSLPWPDKLSLVGTILPEDFDPPLGSSAEIEHLIGTIGSPLATDMQGAWKLTKSTKGYRTVVLTMGDDNATVRFDFTKINGEWRLRLELNPRRLGKSGATAFCELLDYYAPYDFALARFLSKAHLTRIDVATDIVGVPIFDLLVTVKLQGKRATYTGENGALETIYIYRRKPPQAQTDVPKAAASKLGPAMVMVYDKVRELASRNLPPPFGPAPVTRVEVVKRHFGSIKVRLSELQSLANPLTKVRVGYAHNAKIGGATWGGYVGLRRTFPAEQAGRLLGVGAQTAGTFEAAMQDHPSDLMVHKSLWAGWKYALEETGLSQIVEHIEKLAGQKIVSGKTDH